MIHARGLVQTFYDSFLAFLTHRSTSNIALVSFARVVIAFLPA